MIYPIISFLAFGLSHLSVKHKIIGLIGGIVPCALFIVFTSYQYMQLTGHWQYSPFSGWQLTNNGMYAYRYVQKENRKPVPPKFEVLDKMIREYFDSTRDIKKYPQEAWMASTVYMWEPRLSLYKYRNNLFIKDTTATELKKWASMGPLYKAYGLFLIKTYPWHFIKYFIYPNAIRYYAPPIEFLELYNGGKIGVTDQTKNWFGYKSTKITMRKNNYKIWELDFYPILTGIINIMMLSGLICYTVLKKMKPNSSFHKGIILGSGLWFINATFTISASSAALRFQSFPIILTTTFSVLLIDWMVQLMATMKHEKKAISPKLIPSFEI